MSFQKVRVNRTKVLEEVKSNRKDHLKQYQEALEGFKEDLEEFYKCQLCSLKQTKDDQDFIPGRTPQPPQHHLYAYNRAIKSLEWSEDDIVEFEQREFQALVMDEWDWTDSWANMYNASAKFPTYTLNCSSPRSDY